MAQEKRELQERMEQRGSSSSSGLQRIREEGRERPNVDVDPEGQQDRLVKGGSIARMSARLVTDPGDADADDVRGAEVDRAGDRSE